MSTPSSPKRFIAGAVCPQCAEMDKLVMFRDAEQQSVRECVRCGYRDVMTEQGPQVLEPSTRVNSPRPGEPTLAHEEPVQLLTIRDSSPPKNTKPH